MTMSQGDEFLFIGKRSLNFRIRKLQNVGD
jgi:hypothetical protein